MVKTVIGVVVGFVLWSVMWIGGDQAILAAFPGSRVPEEAAVPALPLVVYLAWSVVCSIASGAACAAIDRRSARRAVMSLALVLLAVGVVFEAVAWATTPAWYHIVFLLLLVLATIAGGRLAGPRGGGATQGASRAIRASA